MLHRKPPVCSWAFFQFFFLFLFLFFKAQIGGQVWTLPILKPYKKVLNPKRLLSLLVTVSASAHPLVYVSDLQIPKASDF